MIDIFPTIFVSFYLSFMSLILIAGYLKLKNGIKSQQKRELKRSLKLIKGQKDDSEY